jgi:hypothetical protein
MVEERGCGYRVKKFRIYVHLEWQSTLDDTYELWYEPFQKYEKPPSTSLFLVPRAVRGTAFSHTVNHMTELLVLETQSFWTGNQFVLKF